MAAPDTVSAPDVASFSLISAIRYDPALRALAWNTAANAGIPSPFMLLRFHHDRLLAAARVHAWGPASALTWDAFHSACERAVAEYTGPARDGPLKLRPELARDGVVSISVSPTLPLPADPMLASTISPFTDTLPSSLPLFPLFLDTHPTPSSVFTATKTTRRAHYAAARARLALAPYPPPGAPPTPPEREEDVLLWNDAGMLTETSLRNVALFRRGRWTTPADATGGLRGTVRRWLLEQGRVVQDTAGVLTRRIVQDGEMVLVFNGVEGCRLAVARLKK
ncbi:hypothetical protein FA95DRAFT_737893 [Auriscalpium vulgare]|uniref:Uncharacterized protein n=1 Tax=Auriscalpium vulgare TaxID=40419 RepID=A0ACB8SBV8_9AGAM|nr:hypothetical protein FA95DRAFT_737893 [Auriscalpium vulgare]